MLNAPISFLLSFQVTNDKITSIAGIVTMTPHSLKNLENQIKINRNEVELTKFL